MDTEKTRVDKTGKIEEVLRDYPAVCLCAMPGSGRRTAARMLLQKHPEAEPVFLPLQEAAAGHMPDRGGSSGPRWYLTLRQTGEGFPETADGLKRFIAQMGPDDRLFLLADGVLPPAFLELVWGGLAEQILPETFWFTEAETYQYLKKCRSTLNYREVYLAARGWPGCTAILVRMQKQLRDVWTVEELCRRYEVRKYMEETILSALPAEEMALLKERAFFPRLDEELVQLLWEDKGRLTQEALLSRGVMLYVPEKGVWCVHPLFRATVEQQTPAELRLRAIRWYEEKGYIREALECCRNMNDRDVYRAFLIRHYDSLPFLQYASVIRGETDLHIPQLFYLKWMELLLDEKFTGLAALRSAAAGIWKRAQEDGEVREKWMQILFNIAYADPEISAVRWMELLEKYIRPGEKVRLFFVLGESVSYLSGVKDLSGLFACPKKERETYRQLWARHLAPQNQTPYRLAELEYEFLTDGAGGESRERIRREMLAEADEGEHWTVRLGRMYLAYLLADEKEQDETVKERIRRYVRELEKEEADVCRWNSRALFYLAEARWGEKEDLMRWIRETGGDIENRTGKTRIHSVAEAKIHLYLGNYGRAETILQVLIPYFEKNHSWKWLAESLFQKAVIEKETGRTGQAMKTVSESLAAAGPYRYVRIYTGYGRTGAELLEECRIFVEREHAGGTHRKKKYKYGSVLRMPFADWLGYIARRAGRQKKQYLDLQEEQQNIYRVEKLTVTEQMVLQYLEQGYSNAEICSRMNVKLPTVKSHIYNIYRKMGVTTRVQAVQKGKEYGIL